jgi:ribA/ribD-fused uncharacterized protein
MIEDRVYIQSKVVSFYKTDEYYGLLSNMKGRQKLIINNIVFYSSESIYQVLRYPDNKQIQEQIYKERSPLIAKRISQKYLEYTRKDWEEVKNNIMRFSLRVKAMQSTEFKNVLMNTSGMDIVEISRKDDYWGAIKINDNELKGKNVLGRLLMELRFEVEKDLIIKRLERITTCIPKLIINGKQITINSLLSDSRSSKVFRLDSN